MIYYEKFHKPLLSRKQFYRRLMSNFMFSLLIIVVSLSIGIAGYMQFAQLNFVDALLNASMILGGMGPVDVLPNDEAKYFASFYALFSGITFVTTVGVVFAPLIHRMMHHYNLQTDEDENKVRAPSGKK